MTSTSSSPTTPTPESVVSSNHRRSSDLQNVLIVGATGVIGTYITEAIVTHKAELGRVAVLTSKETLKDKIREIAALESGGVDVFVGLLDDEETVKDAYRGIDTIISCLGREAILKQIPLIRWAAETRTVRRFYTSEYGTDIEYWPERSAHEPPHHDKWTVRTYMKEVQKWSDLEYTYLVTGPYSDLYFGPFLANPELGSFNVKERKAVLLGTGDEEVSFTAMADVGKFLLSALLRPALSRNTTLIVHSFTATPHQILAEYERQTTPSPSHHHHPKPTPWTVTYTPLSRLHTLETAAYQLHQSQSAIATVITLRRIWTEGGTIHKYYDDEGVLEMAEGLEGKESLESQVRKSVERQRWGMGDEGNDPLRPLRREGDS